MIALGTKTYSRQVVKVSLINVAGSTDDIIRSRKKQGSLVEMLVSGSMPFKDLSMTPRRDVVGKDVSDIRISKSAKDGSEVIHSH